MRITNTDNRIVEFSPVNVFMITHHDAFFQVMGMNLHERVFGDMDDFLKSLPNVQSFIPLTWVGDGTSFWVNVNAIKEIRPVDENTKRYYPDAQSNVALTGGTNRVVTQDRETIRPLMIEAGSDISDSFY